MPTNANAKRGVSSHIKALGRFYPALARCAPGVGLPPADSIARSAARLPFGPRGPMSGSDSFAQSRQFEPVFRRARAGLARNALEWNPVPFA